MAAPITTRIPSLTASAKRDQPSSCGANNATVLSTTFLSDTKAQDTFSRAPNTLLQAFARFVLAFVGDDEAVFSFYLPLTGEDISEVGSRDEEGDHRQLSRGYVHAILEDGIRSSQSNANDAIKVCNISVHRDQSCDSEFTLVWDDGNYTSIATKQSVSLKMQGKLHGKY
jgi:hypothetical protein